MQPSHPSTSQASFTADPAFSGSAEANGSGASPAGPGASSPDAASASASTAAPSKAKQGSGEAASFLERLLRRLQDNRLQSGDPETARKLQEINRSQNASNIILKKVLNIAFVTTGVALLLSVIIVIVYTSIVKHSSKPDDQSFPEADSSNGQQSALNGGTMAPVRFTDHRGHHVHQQTFPPHDMVLVNLDRSSHDGGGSDRTGEGSDTRRFPSGEGSEGHSVGHSEGRNVVTKCRSVPISKDGKIQMRLMCFQSPNEGGVYSIPET